MKFYNLDSGSKISCLKMGKLGLWHQCLTVLLSTSLPLWSCNCNSIDVALFKVELEDCPNNTGGSGSGSSGSGSSSPDENGEDDIKITLGGGIDGTSGSLTLPIDSDGASVTWPEGGGFGLGVTAERKDTEIRVLPNTNFDVEVDGGENSGWVEISIPVCFNKLEVEGTTLEITEEQPTATGSTSDYEFEFSTVEGAYTEMIEGEEVKFSRNVLRVELIVDQNTSTNTICPNGFESAVSVKIVLDEDEEESNPDPTTGEPESESGGGGGFTPSLEQQQQGTPSGVASHLSLGAKNNGTEPAGVASWGGDLNQSPEELTSSQRLKFYGPTKSTDTVVFYRTAGVPASGIRQISVIGGYTMDVIEDPAQDALYLKYYLTSEMGAPAPGEQAKTPPAGAPIKQTHIISNAAGEMVYKTFNGAILDQHYKLTYQWDAQQQSSQSSRVDYLKGTIQKKFGKKISVGAGASGNELIYRTTESLYSDPSNSANESSATVVSRSRSVYQLFNATVGVKMIRSVVDPQPLSPVDAFVPGRADGAHDVTLYYRLSNGFLTHTESSNGSWNAYVNVESRAEDLPSLPVAQTAISGLAANVISNLVSDVITGVTVADISSISVSPWGETTYSSFAPAVLNGAGSGYTSDFSGLNVSVSFKRSFHQGTQQFTSLSFTGGVLSSWSVNSEYLSMESLDDLDGLDQRNSYRAISLSDTSARALVRSTYSYPNDWLGQNGDDPSQAFLRGRVYASIDHLEGVRTTYKYAKGVYDANARTFTENPTGKSTRTRSIIGGKVGATSIHGKAYVGTRQESIIDQYGRNVLTRLAVHTGGGAYTDMQTTENRYNGARADELVETWRYEGDGSGQGVQTYRAVYEAHEVVESYNEFGVKSTSENLGAVQTSTTADGHRILTSSTTTDLAGRAISSTDPYGLTTTYSYDLANQTQEVLAPDGTTTVSQTEDGGRRSVVIFKDHNGTRLTTTTTQSTVESGGSLADRILVSTTTTEDHVDGGTIISVSRSNVLGSVSSTRGNLTTTALYDVSCGCPIGSGTVGSSNPSQALVALSDQDLYEGISRSGLDLDGDLQLTSTSLVDRIRESESRYAFINGQWYVVNESYLFLDSGARALQRTTFNSLDGRISYVTSEAQGELGGTLISTTPLGSEGHQKVTIWRRAPGTTNLTETVYAGYSTLLKTSPSLYASATVYSQYVYNTAGDNRLDRVENISPEETVVTKYVSYVPQGSYGAGQPSEVVQAFGANEAVSSVYTYAATGGVASVTGGASYPLSYSYTGNGRLKTLTTYRGPNQTLPSVTTWNYDLTTGQLQQKLDHSNKGPVYTYDDFGRLKTRQWARGGGAITTTYGYDPSGDLQSITYAGDGGMTPDISGMLYDRAGRLTQVTDGQGTRKLTYTDAGRPKDEWFTSTSSSNLFPANVTRTYNNHQRMSLQLRYGLGSAGAGDLALDQGYTYLDHVLLDHRLDTITADHGYIAQYGYHLKTAQPESVTHRRNGINFLQTQRSFDSWQRVASVTNKSMTEVGQPILAAAGTSSAPILRDSLGRITSITQETGDKWLYGYNSKGELTSAKKQLANQTALPGYDFGYQYDEIGNRTQVERGLAPNREVLSYIANELNQYNSYENATHLWLAGSTAAAANVSIEGSDQPVIRQGENYYAGAPVSLGNENGVSSITINVRALLDDSGTSLLGETQKTIHSAPHQVAPSYDDDGNLKQDGAWDYSWNANNRLIEMVSRPGLPYKKLQFEYDYVGRRVAKHVYHTSTRVNPNESWHYVYDGWNIIAQRNPDQLYTYIWGLDMAGSWTATGGVGALLHVRVHDRERVDHEGPLTVIHHSVSPGYDHSGNVTIWSENGENINRIDYDAFGNVLSDTHDQGVLGFRDYGRLFDIGVSSKMRDVESGLIYYGYRHYDPKAGRWLSRDPVEERGGANIYGMINNQVVNGIDYLGKFRIMHEWLANIEDFFDDRADELDDAFEDTVNEGIFQHVELVEDMKK